ncbi:MAG: hypothetical protein R2708_28795 [Vicinamibacterales bacterium]
MPATAQTAPSVIADVRGAIAKGDFAAGERILAAYRKDKGTTPEALEAMSWLGRGALAAKQLDQANRYAEATYDLCLAALKTRKMDDEPRLPIAIGAAIEVRAHVAAERGARADAVYFLTEELATYKATSIRTRIQKNINLLSLEGKAAPELEISESIGSTRPATLAALKVAGRGLLLGTGAPTARRWGRCSTRCASATAPRPPRVADPAFQLRGGAQSAPPAEEMAYIAGRDEVYPWMAQAAVPVNEENFKARREHHADRRPDRPRRGGPPVPSGAR